MRGTGTPGAEGHADRDRPRRGVVAHADATPDKLAVVSERRSVTYGELLERSRRLAAVLANMGAGPGHPVAAVISNRVEPFEVATAAAMAGAPFLPVNWHLKAGELAYLLQDAAVGAVVGEASLRGELSTAMDQADLGRPLLVDDDYEARLRAAPIDASLDSGPGPELVFYTSGTTARPKGVEHGGLGEPAARGAGLEGQVMLWNWTAEDVYLMSGPWYHASHAGWGLTALYVGATLVVPERFEARSFLRDVERHDATRSFMVPSHFIRVLEIPRAERDAIDTSSLRLVVHAAAPCPVAVKRRMMEEFPTTEIHELYGATEGGATRISPAEWLERPGSVGLPWPGVEIRILAEDGAPLGPGEDGIVWIKPPGAHRFRYRNDEEATTRAWRDGAFTVGDIGHLDEAGYLTITDRTSDMVLWGGVNIAPREIEEVLYEHPDVVDCAVFGIPDERDGEHLKAMVELRDSARGSVSAQQLAGYVGEHLAKFKVPQEWELVDELPRDPNGKVIKRLLRQAHGS